MSPVPRRGAVIAVTGAAGVITFSGVVAGPPIFGALAALTGSTRTGFAAVAVVSAAGAYAFAIRPAMSAKRAVFDESDH